jgi:hypothetical protein
MPPSPLPAPSRPARAALAVLLGAALALGADAARADPTKGVSKGGEHGPTGASSPSDSGSTGSRTEHDDRSRTLDAAGRTPDEARTERVAGIALTAGGAVFGGVGVAMFAAGSSSPSSGASALQPVGGLIAGIGGLGLLVGVPLLIHSLMGTDKPTPAAAPAAGVSFTPTGFQVRF